MARAVGGTIEFLSIGRGNVQADPLAALLRGHQCKGNGPAYGICDWLAFKIWNLLRLPTGERDPDAGKLVAFQEDGPGQQRLRGSLRAAAGAKIRPMYFQRLADCAGNRMLRSMRNKMWRNTPGALVSMTLQGNDKRRTSQKRRRCDDTPIGEACLRQPELLDRLHAHLAHRQQLREVVVQFGGEQAALHDLRSAQLGDQRVFL